MSNADDYGKGRSELVPSGLRVYRHFKVTQDGMLAPTIINSDPFEPGVNRASCYAGYRGYRYNFYGPGTRYRIPKASCIDCGGTGRIMRLIPERIDYRSFLEVDPFGPEYHARQVEDHCPCVTDECKSPDVDCACGFYASYSPETNFFEGSLRDAQRDKLNGVRSNAGYSGGIFRNHDLPPIFAVVEASGRVLMGSKGVRSERMEVKALAFDYEHSHFSHALEYGTIDLDRIGKTYGVPVFSYIHTMVTAFPQPDLSNLLKNQES